MNIVTEIIDRLTERGGGYYAGEPITELQHALQTAYLAEKAGASPEMVVAALLHDFGHLLHDLPENFTSQGLNDQHEMQGAMYLKQYFPPAVCDPIRLHVAAKRYLCTTDPKYSNQLSQTSRLSLELQGGLMNSDEIKAFEAEPHWQEALEIRWWDDQAKIPHLIVPGLSHYVPLIEQVCLRANTRGETD